MVASALVPLCSAKIPFHPIPGIFRMSSAGASPFCQGIKQTHPLKLQNIPQQAEEPDTGDLGLQGGFGFTSKVTLMVNPGAGELAAGPQQCPVPHTPAPVWSEREGITTALLNPHKSASKNHRSQARNSG